MAVGQTALNNAAIVKMHAAGLDDDTIVALINSQPGNYSLGVEDAIALKTAGIGGKVIAAMAGKASTTSTNTNSTSLSDEAGTALAHTHNAFESPRVYVGAQSVGNVWAALRDQSMELSKDLERGCPFIKITITQKNADYTVLLNHIEVGTFGRDNQIQVADSTGDLISSTKEGGSIDGNARKSCLEILNNWFAKCCDIDNPETQYRIGQVYSDIHKGDDLAIDWFKKSAANGYVPAEIEMGTAYANGRSVRQDYQQSYFWFEKAANLGDARAAKAIGYMYLNHEGVALSYADALFWLELSGKMGGGSVDTNVRKLITPHLTAQDLQAIESRESNWLHTHPVH